MPTITFSGLSSGLDTDSIVSSLVEVKTQQLITPLQNRVTDITSKQSALSAIRTLASNLKSAANTLRTASIQGRSAASSDTDVLSIDSTDSDAVNGAYSVTVNQLATTDKVYFAGEADKDTTTFGTGTVTITSDGVTRTVVIDGTNNTLEQIAEAINDTAGINVTAAVVNDGGANPYRLVLASKTTGNDANITQDLDTVLTGLAVDAGLTGLNDSDDASIVINSLTITRSDNTFSDAIPGVTFTIKDDNLAPTVTVTVQDDFSSTTSAVSSFVAYYNSLMGTIGDQFTYDEATESLGPLGADFMLHQAQSRIKRIVFDIYDTLGNQTVDSVSKLGVTVDENGVMSLDSTALNDALTNNADEVKVLFQGEADSTSDEDGLMEDLYNYLDALDNSTDGLFTVKDTIYADTLSDINDLIDEREDRIESYEENLLARYANLELVLSQLKSSEDLITSFSEQMTAMFTRKR